MKALVFDIETADLFDAVKKNSADLTLALVGAYSYPRNEYATFTQEELPKLWEWLREIDTLVGFNSNHFDIPLLQKYTDINLKEFNSIDILESVRQTLGRRIRLDWIAEATLGKKKSADGLIAQKWWAEGEVQKVRDYCLQDVKITKDVFEYARDNKKLNYIDLGVTHTITIDTSYWEKEESVYDSNASLF